MVCHHQQTRTEELIWLTVHVDMHRVGDRPGEVGVCGRAGQLGVEKGSIDGPERDLVADGPIAQYCKLLVNQAPSSGPCHSGWRKPWKYTSQSQHIQRMIIFLLSYLRKHHRPNWWSPPTCKARQKFFFWFHSHRKSPRGQEELKGRTKSYKLLLLCSCEN